MVGKNISHHQVLEKLGEGGMGVVCKAHDIGSLRGCGRE
jgi:serine/threonine protein kinase